MVVRRTNGLLMSLSGGEYRRHRLVPLASFSPSSSLSKTRRWGTAGQQKLSTSGGSSPSMLSPTRVLLQAATTTTTSSSPADVFERYSEIDNSNEKRIQALKSLGMDKDDWIATEKVHGANFGIYSTDHGRSLRFAKRSGIMPPNEHFFGYHVLLPEFQEQIKVIRHLVCEHAKADVHTVIVNGELFGGKYVHPQVPKSKQTFLLAGKPKTISAVQTDSFPQYSPNLHFYAFDIKYRIQAGGGEGEVTTMMYDDATKIFEKVPRLLYAKAIIRGPMDKVAAFDVESFVTTIPPLVGMGNFPLKGNWAEGLVVKHAKRGVPGWEPKGPTVLKFKCVAFQEISTDRRQGPRVDQMEQVRKDSIAKSGAQLPSLESVFQTPLHLSAAQHLLDHICENRLKSVLSKCGTAPFESKEMTPQQLSLLLAEDALKDFLKDADDALVVSTPVLLRKELARFVLFEAKRFVGSRWTRVVQERLSFQQEADDAAAASATRTTTTAQ